MVPDVEEAELGSIKEGSLEEDEEAYSSTASIDALEPKGVAYRVAQNTPSATHDTSHSKETADVFAHDSFPWSSYRRAGSKTVL